MKNIEFIKVFNEILNSEINNENLFINNDFSAFYTKILNKMNIYNINNVLNYFENNIDNYNDFYNSLNSLYILKYGISKVINQNIHDVAKEIISEHIDVNDYIYFKFDNIMNKRFQTLRNNLIKTHKDIINRIINNFDNFYEDIENNIYNIINDKEYLLDSVSSNYFVVYLNDSVLTNIDINILNKYLDNGRYEIINVTPDEVFIQLQEEKISVLLATDCINAEDYSSKKIQYILSLYSLRELFEISGLNYYDNYYKEIKYISEEDLNFILKHKKIHGIENCNYVLNNIDYVKKIIKSGYSKIFCYLKPEQVDDEMLDNIDCFDILFCKNDNSNLSNLLLDNKVFLTFSKRCNYSLIFDIIGSKNITREMVLFCMINGMDNSIFDFLDKDSFEKVKKYYSRTPDDIIYAINCGYKCSESTTLQSSKEAEIFIEHGQPEIIDYYRSDFNTIKKAVLNGYLFNERLEELLRGNDEEYDELLKLAYDNKLINFCDSLIINIHTRLLNDLDIDLLNLIYKDNPEIKNYISFKLRYSGYLPIETRKDIFKYFNADRLDQNLYELALFDYSLFQYLIYNCNIKLENFFQNDKAILNYIKLKKRIDSDTPIINKENLVEKVNRVHAMKEKLLGRDYRYEIGDIIISQEEILDGYASSDFYVYIDNDYNIHSDYIESIYKDNKLISYGQSSKALEDTNKYIDILRKRYMEVRHVL